MADAIVAALVGAFAAYIFNHLHWSYSRKFDIKRQYVESIIKKVEWLEKISVDYWVLANEGSSEPEKHLVKDRLAYEVNIKSSFASINQHTCEYWGCYNPAIDQKILDKNLGDIFEATTGDDFEQIDRKSNKQKCYQISSCCTDLTLILQKSLYTSEITIWERSIKSLIRYK